MALPAQFKTQRGVPDKVAVTVPLEDGTEYKTDCFVRRLTFAELPMLGLIEGMEDKSEAAKAKAHIIALALVEADGVTPVCTAEEACELDPLVGMQIFTAILRGAALGKRKAV